LFIDDIEDLILGKGTFEYIFNFILSPNYIFEFRNKTPHGSFSITHKKLSIDGRFESALRPARSSIALLAHFRFSSARERNAAHFISHGVEH